MAKKNEKQAQGLETVNDSNNSNTTIQDIVARDLVIKEKNTYSNYDPEKEPEIQRGLATLLELGVNPFIIAIGKFWNDRETWKQVRAMIAEEATKAGKTQADYEQNVLRPEYDKFAAIQGSHATDSHRWPNPSHQRQEVRRTQADHHRPRRTQGRSLGELDRIEERHRGVLTPLTSQKTQPRKGLGFLFAVFVVLPVCWITASYIITHQCT